MFIGILTLITALTISSVAIYYSVAGLVAIFAAAALPIMIMGGALEIGKLVTAVWLHRYWSQTVWWLRSYLAIAVVVLMLITSMGIFGFLSKAHIEQTSASQESVAQVERITTEIARQEALIERAETKIKQIESSGSSSDVNIQSQIDKEQDRIDKAFERIQPAIQQQNKIIEDARAADGNRTKPFEDQLTNIQSEISRLEQTAREYEDKIAGLKADDGVVGPILEQIASIEEEIIRVTNQLNSKEQSQIRAAQAIIGVTNDGLFGNNTRTALAKWVQAQRDRITQLQGQVATARQGEKDTVSSERNRLAGIVKDIRTVQIPALKERELTMLSKIDEVRQTESPVIATARDEIQRLRESAEAQVKNSQDLIERLRSQLAQEDKAADIDAAVDEQQLRIKNANAEIDKLTEEKYTLEAEYRKLEAEVGPVKYIAEFVYGERADTDLLEEAVRWVILVIIFVFDPLAVLLLIASQYTFEFHRKDKGDRLRQEEWKAYEQARAQKIVDNSRPAHLDEENIHEASDRSDDEQSDRDENDDRDTGGDTNNPSDTASNDSGEVERVSGDTGTGDSGGSNTTELSEPAEEERQLSLDFDSEDSKKKKPIVSSEELKVREQKYLEKEKDETFQLGKAVWKKENPNQTLKRYKNLYIQGVIDELPWEKPQNYAGYQQNEEQNESSLFNKVRRTEQDQDNNST